MRQVLTERPLTVLQVPLVNEVLQVSQAGLVRTVLTVELVHEDHQARTCLVSRVMLVLPDALVLQDDVVDAGDQVLQVRARRSARTILSSIWCQVNKVQRVLPAPTARTAFEV